MALFSSTERRFAQAISDLAHCNPFAPERMAFERAALGDEFDPHQADWNVRIWNRPEDWPTISPNVRRLIERNDALLDRVQSKLARDPAASGAEVRLYQDLVLFALYYHPDVLFERKIQDDQAGKPTGKVKLVDPLIQHASRYLRFADRDLAMWDELPHLIACLYQVRRAFHNIYHYILGKSEPAVRLRAVVWESIFTHDLRRYRRVLYDQMANFTTLITGPSGTGKELVARAIGLSRYIPFEASTGRFADKRADSFFALNLSALSPTLIESELFGHKRGSFTGAIEDRVGWLEVCPAYGTVFLDEIGELDPAIQVKLLRVLQDRSFSRLGETQVRRFQGKLIAATNRDLASQMRQGEFREDLYYRLCSDVVVVPGLRERMLDDPTELPDLVNHIAQRLVGDEAPAVAEEVMVSIATHLGVNYAWPGNIRELEQCVRNVLVRKEYRPAAQARPEGSDPMKALWAAFTAGELTADAVLRAYCTIVYARTGSYDATARQIALDRRTVKAKVDEAFLAELGG